MVLRNSRSIQKHRTGCELSYCDMHEAGCAFAWRSHLTKSCLSWDISDVTSCNTLVCRSDVTFSPVDPQPSDIHMSKKKQCLSTTQQQYPSTIQQVQGASVNRAILRHCFFWFGNTGADAAIAILLPTLKRFSCNGAVDWSTTCFCCESVLQKRWQLCDRSAWISKSVRDSS